VPNVTNAQHTCGPSNNPTITANTAYAATVFVKANGYTRVNVLLTNTGFSNGVQATYNLTTGAITAVGNVGTGSGAAALIQQIGNGWWRCSISGVIDATSTTGKMAIYADNGLGNNFAGDGTSGLLVWGAQLEAGNFPTSYIPTTSAAVTRNGDFYDISPTPWLVAGSGSFAAEWLTNNYATVGGGCLRLDDGTANNSENINLAASTPYNANGSQAAANVNNYNSPQINLAFGAVNKAALAWAATGNLFYANATPTTIGVAVAIPTGMNRLRIGNVGTGVARTVNGWMRRVQYWSRALSANELQQVTT
jgi:hypothetical protein